MDVKSRKAEQSEATRAALIKAARELFTAPGFAETPAEEIVRRAGVTRGALYHHFRDKQDLFRAVVEEIESEVTGKVAAASMGGGGVWEGILAACDTFLDECLDPSVHRILLVDAPSVLGLQAWREIEARYGLALTEMALNTAMDEGLVERQPVGPMAHIVLGALNEASLLIGSAADPKAARAEVGAAVRRLLNGLLVR